MFMKGEKNENFGKIDSVVGTAGDLYAGTG
jgi:hypothetical protein